MKDKRILGVIPARYASSRFPGKPLADICGKPMIWRVYQQLMKVNLFDDILVATDDERIARVCKENGMQYLMTSDKHPTSLNRIHEVSTLTEGDIFVSVNGDEPLINPRDIDRVIETYIADPGYEIVNAMRIMTDPVDVIDFTNVKVVTNNKNECVYLSRSPIPYPKASLDFVYKKFVGITLLSRNILKTFSELPRGELEKVEDNDSIRFIENHIIMKFVDIESETISVDTEKDLIKVCGLIPPPPPNSNSIFVFIFYLPGIFGGYR
jgi:3-deoxy-manno-octulosonate cytidylyltransferase (CMP-KDO synthetase)